MSLCIDQVLPILRLRLRHGVMQLYQFGQRTPGTMPWVKGTTRTVQADVGVWRCWESQECSCLEFIADFQQHDFCANLPFGIGPQTAEDIALTQACNPSQRWMIFIVKVVQQK